MCNNSKKQKSKKISTSRNRSEFRAQRYGYKLPKKVGKPCFEKGVHTSCKHVSEGFVNFIPKEDRPANSRDLTPLKTIWIIVDETDTKIKPPKHWTS